MLKQIFTNTLHLFYPAFCLGCGSDLVNKNQLLCLQCIISLPHTGFEKMPENPVEKIFRGRVNIKAAHSEFYFSKGQVIQQLIHQLKYKGNQEAGIYLGKIMADKLLAVPYFADIDYLVPLPMFPAKEFKRGYNQATIICNGMSEVMNIPVSVNNIVRRHATETQTRKHRTERWENVADSFQVNFPALLEGKHILLVDDVLTTGATLEACCLAMAAIPGISVSLATLAIASK
ncbi:ComF family protein [Ferruginibacter sp. HRS2-29]|uniref:ComF family protein n=1 Tax=Ferruginibacter sp. HRS2-29 TaxID=2487334 RepID=UPI0020CDAEF5|nr:phosphoribosyltransferase family protein [Ferruginibacter sp. HRS2-29]